MNKTSCLKSGFLLTQKRFIDYISNRGFDISDKFLVELEKRKILKPVLKKKNEKYYDELQIYIIAVIKNKITQTAKFLVGNVILGKASLFDSLLDDPFVTRRIKEFNKFLPLLQEIRYFFWPVVNNVYSTQYGYKVDEISIKKHTDEVINLQPEEIIKEHKVNQDQIDDLRKEIVVTARSIDPAAGWYVFMRNLRKKRRNEFYKLKSDLLLAHDCYQISEMITMILEKFDKNITQVEDVYDLSGGKWKVKKCVICLKSFKAINFDEKYCQECKPVLKQGVKAALLCEKCKEEIGVNSQKKETILIRYIDGDYLHYLTYPNANIQVSKSDKNVNEKQQGYQKGPIDIYLDYGLLHILVVCPKCGHENYRVLESGFFS